MDNYLYFNLMNFLRRLKNAVKKRLITKNPVRAYNLLASTYDHQKGNLLMELDEALLNELLQTVDLKGKTVIDLGCGTGRHWKKLNEHSVQKLIGVDSSEKMLEILKTKYPSAETYLSVGSKVKNLNDQSADILISTLTIGYIKDIESAFQEWDRLLTEKGQVIITEYHPALLQMGGGRSFKYKEKVIAVENYIHTIDKLRTLAEKNKWQEIQFVEKKIDESLENYYAQQNAQSTYEKYKGTGIIYGLHFKK